MELLVKENFELREKNEAANKKIAALEKQHKTDISNITFAVEQRLNFLSEIINQSVIIATQAAKKYNFDLVIGYENGKECPLSRAETANTREVRVAVSNGIIMGHYVTYRSGSTSWVPAACFPYRFV